MAKPENNSLGFEIVQITDQIVEQRNAEGPSKYESGGIPLAPLPPSDVIRRGDTLAISIYEIGVALFGSSGALAANTADPTANAHSISVQVDDNCSIAIPYIGRINVKGKTTAELSQYIEGQLRRNSQSPQVMVAISESVESAAYVTGYVARPGRYRLSAAREQLLDVVALAGGASINADDVELRLVRNDRALALRLGDLRPEDANNLTIAAGDRIELMKRPQTYTVFGATDRVSQVPFDGRRLSLAEAVARAAGPSDQRANPTGVFLFRFENGEDGQPDKPVIYRLDLMNPASYFLSQRFQMRDKDVIYFANAEMNPPMKFINLISQMFTPFLAARALSK